MEVITNRACEKSSLSEPSNLIYEKMMGLIDVRKTINVIYLKVHSAPNIFPSDRRIKHRKVHT